MRLPAPASFPGITQGTMTSLEGNPRTSSMSLSEYFHVTLELTHHVRPSRDT